ncbi:MAG: T9SS type A sorting domain-containing protein [Candidatus Delongbacteria bacterium]|nr:T9SS type A sorting domain-containing protein [Candidatus Delongbacteria bacterium]
MGIGVSLTSSNGNIIDNTIEEFDNGIIMTLCSPLVTGNDVSNNNYYGIFTTGYNTIPQLINPIRESVTVNNNIVNNGLGNPYYQGGQIYTKYAANVYLENGCNNIYSTHVDYLPTVPSIRGDDYLSSKSELPDQVVIRAKNNYWGASELDSYYFEYYFDLYERYSISYEPCAYAPFANDVVVNSGFNNLTTEGKLLSQAMKAELEDKIDLAIKKYEMIIDKYPETEEYYIATTRLTDVLIKTESTLEPLLAIYDAMLESDDTFNKKFFKEMKVSSFIKSKNYDEAITLAEEMKAEATSEGEMILADIDIAISNKMKESESKGAKSKTEHTDTINDLLAKLNGNEEGVEKTDIVGLQLPTEIKLHQNYPNPFNPTTEIKFTLPTASDVKLNVYNINGQIVSELVNGSKEAGLHTVNFDASNYNSGMYFYTLEANGMSITKKMILTK